jgi:hypothetical protein
LPRTLKINAMAARIMKTKKSCIEEAARRYGVSVVAGFSPAIDSRIVVSACTFFIRT